MYGCKKNLNSLIIAVLISHLQWDVLDILCVCAQVLKYTQWLVSQIFIFTCFYKVFAEGRQFLFFFPFFCWFLMTMQLHLKKGYLWYLSLVSLFEFSEPAFWLIVMSAIHLDLCIGSSSLSLAIGLFCYWRHWWKHSINFITDFNYKLHFYKLQYECRCPDFMYLQGV